MALIVKRWCDVNTLKKPDRAPVWCKPVGCWSELLPHDSLFCIQPLERELETYFRRVLIKYDIGDDDPVLPYYPVRARILSNPVNRYGVDIHHTRSEEQGGAWSFDPPLKEPDDFDKLVRPEFFYDKKGSEELGERISAILGDALPVRIINSPSYDEATVIGSMTAELRGLENFMMDTVLNSEFLHRLATYLRDVQMDYLDTMEKTGINEPNTFQSMLMYPQPEKSAGDEFYHLNQCLTSGNSQEYDQVSPEAFEAFLLDYQLPLLNRFGLTAYGCCENLTHKLDIIKSKVKNLRIITCSAWTNLDVLLEKMGPEYCIMWRQKATDVVMPGNEKELRQPLEEGCEKLQNRSYQIVLRELQTLRGERERLHQWTRIAKDAAERWA